MSFYDSLSAKVYLMEKHIRENEPSPRFAGEAGKPEQRQPWYLSSGWRNSALAHLKLGFYKILLGLARVGLIIRGKPASNFTVFTRAGKDGLYICNYSYCYYKDFHNKTRNKAIATIIAATILLSLIISLIFPGYPGVKAATYNYNWSQTNWADGLDAGVYPNHTSNQSNWTKYSAKDADLTAGASNIILAGINNAGSIFLDTTEESSQFGGGAHSGTYVSGTGTGASVILQLPPSQVTGLSATVGNAQLILNWTAPANNGSAITSYKVYRGTSSGGESLLSSGGCSGLASVLTCTDTGLTNGTTYYYKVSAVNAIGEGTQSSEASAIPIPCGATTSVTDIDGNTYNTVGINGASQCWMATNMMTTKYPDGTAITRGPTDATWNGSDNGYYAYPPNTGNTAEETMANIQANNLGFVYQWSAVMHGASSCNGTGESQPACSSPVQGICPTGFHIPSHHEWTLLEKNVGSNPGAFPYNSTTTGWLGTNEGTNLKSGGSSGFNGVLAGDRNTDGSFVYRGTYANLWSSTQYPTSNAWFRALGSDYATVNRNHNSKAFGFSVRCLKD